MWDGESQADMIHVDLPRPIANKSSNRRVENREEARRKENIINRQAEEPMAGEAKHQAPGMTRIAYQRKLV